MEANQGIRPHQTPFQFCIRPLKHMPNQQVGYTIEMSLSYKTQSCASNSESKQGLSIIEADSFCTPSILWLGQIQEKHLTFTISNAGRIAQHFSDLPDQAA